MVGLWGSCTAPFAAPGGQRPPEVFEVPSLGILTPSGIAIPTMEMVNFTFHRYVGIWVLLRPFGMKVSGFRVEGTGCLDLRNIDFTPPT